MPLARRPSAALAGIGLMLLAALCGAGVNACYRAALREGLPVPLVPFARGLITLAILSPWILRAGPIAALATRRPKLHRRAVPPASPPSCSSSSPSPCCRWRTLWR
ncbi:hypothetical protein [Teichococcus aestuarii]|uniref:hypothetical protein n=1 Tax=Teichococcus aestuarii TaxID=568898 RepID=UPI00362213C2